MFRVILVLQNVYVLICTVLTTISSHITLSSFIYKNKNVTILKTFFYNSRFKKLRLLQKILLFRFRIHKQFCLPNETLLCSD